jgi:hypothetical protein
MQDLAESSETERSADFVFTVHQSDDARASNLAVLQTLKFRRGRPDRNWELRWRLDVGDIRVKRELTDES